MIKNYMGIIRDSTLLFEGSEYTAFLFAPNIGSRYGRHNMAKKANTTTKISKKMMAIIFVPLTIPSFSLVGFALSDFSRDGASTMLIVALALFLINIAVFFFAYRVLTKKEPQASE